MDMLMGARPWGYRKEAAFCRVRGESQEKWNFSLLTLNLDLWSPEQKENSVCCSRGKKY